MDITTAPSIRLPFGTVPITPIPQRIHATRIVDSVQFRGDDEGPLGGDPDIIRTAYEKAVDRYGNSPDPWAVVEETSRILQEMVASQRAAATEQLTGTDRETSTEGQRGGNDQEPRFGGNLIANHETTNLQ